MIDWYLFLKITHFIGVALGVGGATFAEIFYLKAKRDGVIEPLEADYMKTAVFVLRLGLFILVVSGFGFFLVYRFTLAGALILDPQLWAKLTIVLVLIFNAFLTAAQKAPMWLASAISFTSWYAALIIGAWSSLEASYSSVIIVYIIAIFVVALILEIIRKALKIPS
jgi:hypothetical protein